MTKVKKFVCKDIENDFLHGTFFLDGDSVTVEELLHSLTNDELVALLEIIIDLWDSSGDVSISDVK